MSSKIKIIDDEFYDDGKLCSVYEIELFNNEDPEYANTLQAIKEKDISKVTAYYNDQIRSIKYIKNPNEILHGPSYYYDDNGELCYIEHWYNGKLEDDEDIN